MDDKQLALLLTAMGDQTAAMNRMADALTGILLHVDPKQAAKFAAPGYMRPLAAYASFDWNSIDAHVIAFDRHGATEVEHNGVAYRRYRSNDDDPKGIDIRFRRVVSGTPEGKDMIWATLIKFADKKAKDAPRPLRGELAEKIDQAASIAAMAAAAKSAHAPAAAACPASIAVAVAPTTPAPIPAEAVEVSAEHVAAQVRVDMAQAAAKASGMRPIDDLTRSRVYLALEHASHGDQDVRSIVNYLFERTTFKAVTSAEAWALQGWLKPTQHGKAWVASSAKALDEIKAILSAVAELQPA